MKILIAGLGSIGQRHFANLQVLGFRDLLAHRVRGHRVPQMDEWRIPIHHDLEEALDEKPDVVFVTNPTSLHLPVALAGARRGCHLFIEKPLSHTLEGVAELKALVQSRRLVAMVGCQLRFHPLLRQARQLLRDGAIGRVVSARVHVGDYLPDWHPGEDYRQGYSAREDLGGGVILTLIHELDYAYWLFGEVEQVTAVAGTWSGLELDVEDTAEMVLKTAAGARISVHMDYVQRPPARTLMVIGEEGTLTWDYYANALRWYSASSGTWQAAISERPVEWNDLFVDELRHFFSCIEGRTEPSIPLGEAERVLEIALAAKQSAVSGRPVQLTAPLATQVG